MIYLEKEFMQKLVITLAQALMEKNVGVYEAVVDGLHSVYMENHKVYDF